MKKDTFKITPMTRAHLPACDAIVAVSEPWKTLKEGVDFAKYILLKQAYICVVGGEPAGFVIFTPEPVFARGGYLRAIGVAPSMRGQGIGKKLLAFAERETVRCAQNLFLCVSSFNRQGRLFYEQQGYTQVGRLPGLIKPHRAEYIYWKKIPTMK